MMYTNHKLIIRLGVLDDALYTVERHTHHNSVIVLHH